MTISIRDIGKVNINKSDIVAMCVCDFIPWNIYYAYVSSWNDIVKNRINLIW